VTASDNALVQFINTPLSAGHFIAVSNSDLQKLNAQSKRPLSSFWANPSSIRVLRARLILAGDSSSAFASSLLERPVSEDL
jgi:hypothetical protein